MPQAGPRKVLVVDDDRLARILLREALEGDGFEVLEAPDGPSGLELAFKEQPVLLVLDIMMPGTSGWEITQALRADPKTRHIPILICTVLDKVRDMEKSLALGASDFIAKPYDARELRDKVRKLLQRR